MKTIQAKTKLDALKKAGYENIYWKGNTPYAYTYAIYTHHIFAIKLGKGEFTFYAKRVN